MNSRCEIPPGYTTRYNHQEKCRRLKELFLSEKPSSQGQILVDKNENILNRPANYYFSKQYNIQNKALTKETPMKVKAHITGLPQPQIVQKVSFLSNKSTVENTFRENYLEKLLEKKSGGANDFNAVNPATSLRLHSSNRLLSEDLKNMNVKDPANESTFAKAKRALFPPAGENANETINHSKLDNQRFSVKMMQSFSVSSNQCDKNPTTRSHPAVSTTHLMQKRRHSNRAVVSDGDQFLIDDEIADQPSLITFEKTKVFCAKSNRDVSLQKNNVLSKKFINEKRCGVANSPNHTSESYYYIYNRLVPDVRSIKSSVLHLKRLLSQTEISNPFAPNKMQNTFYHQLAEADRTSEENLESELVLEQLADTKRQVVYLEEQLRDRDRTIGTLRRQMCGMGVMSNGSCSKATQT